MKEKEIGALYQSLEMYNKTKREMEAMNRPTEIITKEIEDIKQKISLLENITSDETFENNFTEMTEMNDDDFEQLLLSSVKYDVETFRPIKVNCFLVNFPKESGIVPCQVCDFTYDDKGVFVSLRESENDYPVLPIKIKNIADKFDLKADILKTDGSVFYSIIFKGCGIREIVRPFYAYNSSEISVWHINLTYEEKIYNT